MTSNRHADADILVSGAGAAGLAATIALAKAGFSVICAGVSDTRSNGRTVALFEGSLRFLRSIGVWNDLAPSAQPIRAIRMVDDTGARLTVPPLTLEASEIDLDALGSNIENDRLVAGLLEVAAALPNVQLTGRFLDTIAFDDTGVDTVDSSGHRARVGLLVAADGRKSPARLAAGIGARAWTYPQVALTALLGHRKPHGGLSTEFHTRGGPCTLVPLQGTTEHPHRSSLVWLMNPRDGERRRVLDDEAFAADLQHQTRMTVGRITIEPARGFFPMGGLKVNRLAGHRIVLMGEAAHAFPPLAAQGLNLSLRDTAQLVATLETARRAGLDIGLPEALRPYERARRKDIAMRTDGVDILNRSIMTDFGPVDIARGVGAVALRLIGPLRRAVMREGILPPRSGSGRPRYVGFRRDGRDADRPAIGYTRGSISEAQMSRLKSAVVLSTLLLATSPLFSPASFAQGSPDASPAAVEAGTYAIEPNHTQVIFSVLHMGFSYYSGRLTDVSGDMMLDPKTPAASTVRVSVPVASISTTSAKLDAELKSADWLDAARYPAMTFKSTTVTPGDKGAAKVMGDLTLHGVTKSVTLDVKLVGSGINPLDKKYTVGFEISGEIKRSDFGVTKYLPLIGDAVHLSISGAFEKN